MGLLAFVSTGVPLLPKQSDSAWYFAGTRFLESGRYTWESSYPSFTGPSQYYPLGGYSLLLFLVRAVSRALHLDWAGLLRFLQFGALVLTGGFVYGIGARLRSRRVGLAATLLYFLSFPFLNYSALVMSENPVTLLVAAFTFLFLSGLEEDRPGPLVASFLLAGYSVLLKTVLLFALPLMLLAVLTHQWPARRWGHWALLLVAIAAAPLAQSIANRARFGNFRIAGGLGMHLCDRVLFADKSLPVDWPGPYRHDQAERVPVERAIESGSPALRRLVGELERRPPRYIAVDAWHLTSQLLSLGYSREDIGRIRRDVGSDVVAGNDVKFIPMDSALAHGSPAFRSLARELSGRRLRFVALGNWWDLAEQLSPLGYTPPEVERICGEVAFDALLRHKRRYVLNTLAIAAQVLFRDREAYPTRVYATAPEYFDFLEEFRDEPMHRPLLTALQSQARLLSAAAENPTRLDLYHQFSAAFMRAQAFGLQKVIAGGYLLWSLLWIARVARRRHRPDFARLALAVLPALVVLGTCAIEVLEPRYRVPVQPLMIVACCLFLAELPALIARLRSRPD